MALRNSTSSYGGVAKFFHWLIFLLLLFQIIYGYFLDDFPKNYQPITYNIHKLLGLCVLLLMVLRACWALLNAKPAMPTDMPIWQRWTDQLVHLFLYIVVIAMPIAGWIGSVAGGRPPHLGGFVFDLPIVLSKPLAKTAFSIHNTLAIVLIVLFSIHLLAALYHHFIKKDDILRRMMPHL